MSKPTTAQLVALLTSWRDGSQLADLLVPATDALIAQLLAKPTRTATRPVTCQAVDTADLTDAQMFAQYKRSSCRRDCAFALAHRDLAPALRTAFEALQADLGTRPSTTVDRKAYNRLLDQWRATEGTRRRISVSDARLARKRDRARAWLTRQPVELRKVA